MLLTSISILYRYNSDALSCFNWCKVNFQHIGQAVPIYSNSWGCLDCYDPTVYNGLLNTTGTCSSILHHMICSADPRCIWCCTLSWSHGH